MIDFLFIMMYIFLFATILSVVFSVVRRFFVVGKTSGIVQGIPVRKIDIAISASLLAVLILSYLIGNTTPISINGTLYNDTFWLRTTNMLVTTSAICICIACIAIIFSILKSSKLNIKRK